jgi:hypothetical protein
MKTKWKQFMANTMIEYFNQGILRLYAKSLAASQIGERLFLYASLLPVPAIIVYILPFGSKLVAN